MYFFLKLENTCEKAQQFTPSFSRGSLSSREAGPEESGLSGPFQGTSAKRSYKISLENGQTLEKSLKVNNLDLFIYFMLSCYFKLKMKYFSIEI